MTSKATGLENVMQAKVEACAKELIWFDARNILLTFKLTKTTSLDLGKCP